MVANLRPFLCLVVGTSGAAPHPATATTYHLRCSPSPSPSLVTSAIPAPSTPSLPAAVLGMASDAVGSQFSHVCGRMYRCWEALWLAKRTEVKVAFAERRLNLQTTCQPHRNACAHHCAHECLLELGGGLAGAQALRERRDRRFVPRTSFKDLTHLRWRRWWRSAAPRA